MKAFEFLFWYIFLGERESFINCTVKEAFICGTGFCNLPSSY